MQFYIATASDADSADMEWESLQDLEVSEDFDQTSQELLYSINNNLTQIISNFALYDSCHDFSVLA